MRFFHSWPWGNPIKPSVATIGNFDGMHRGHQAVLQQLKTLSKDLQLPSTVILFEPQPQEFFLKEKAPARLQRLSDKLSWLEQYGIDQVVCLRFDACLADLSAKQFIEIILLQRLAIKALLVGEDFRFGKERQGDVTLLRQHPFDVHILQDFCCSGLRVSSTQIRALLANADFTGATELLGRPYVISGKVVHGAKRGRQLQFHTANVPLLRRKSPLYGVYAVKVGLPDGKIIPGVANIGFRPTVHLNSAWYLEVHLLDGRDWQLYGERLQVEPVQKVREEMRFASLEALRTQIAKDVVTAKEMMGLHLRMTNN